MATQPIWFATAHLQLTANVVLTNAAPFRDQGFDVYPMCPGAGEPIVSALLQGRAEYCNVLALPIMRAVQGAPLKFIASYHNSGWELWTRPEITRPADLVGKTLGVTSPMAKHYLDRGLRDLGVDPGDIKQGGLVMLDGSGVTQLVEGRVDGAILMPPVTAMAKLAGLNQLIRLADYGDPVAYGLMTTDRMLTEARDEVKRFVRALMRSTRQLANDRNLLTAQVRGQLIPDEYVELAVATTQPQLNPTGELSEASQRLWIETAKPHVQITEEVPLSQVFDFSLLREVTAEGF